jgi:hypothetical protein
MPLRLTDKLEIYIFMTGAMVFYMIDENDKGRRGHNTCDKQLGAAPRHGRERHAGRLP